MAEFDLVTQFGVSRGAVRETLSALADDGLIDRRQRFGTHATGNAIRLSWDEPPVASGPSKLTINVLADRDVASTPLLQSVLRSEDHHLRMQDIHFSLDGVPLGFRTTYRRKNAPRDLRAVSAELGTVKADSQTARLLCVTAGTPMLTRMQVFAEPTGALVVVTFDQFRGDRVSLNLG